jgi:hypothetical protein
MSDRADDAGAVDDDEPGLSRAARAAQDDRSELVDAEPDDDDEQAEDDQMELDQRELDELGLTLDDPHQPPPD